MRMFTFRAGELVHSHITMIVDLDSVSAIMEIRAVKTTWHFDLQAAIPLM